MRCMPGITKRLGKVIPLMAKGANKGEGSNRVVIRWRIFYASRGPVCLRHADDPQEQIAAASEKLLDHVEDGQRGPATKACGR
jgi:hypothetical protein